VKATVFTYIYTYLDEEGKGNESKSHLLKKLLRRRSREAFYIWHEQKRAAFVSRLIMLEDRYNQEGLRRSYGVWNLGTDNTITRPDNNNIELSNEQERLYFVRVRRNPTRQDRTTHRGTIHAIQNYTEIDDTAEI
jgi:hypothetical protein